ncbi:MAG: Bifunctional protein GlmU [Candidatus Saccharibacteria bacterium GW2011_GWA2_46_10]|nr:MAG: Bifunctional protein GlmU [Candidatus Saccharibacteria bacterium GW2011_GWA2_46_10]
MKVLLLIAGRSRRFWPLSEKTLFPVCGTNLLEVTADNLKKAGLGDITIVGGEHNLKEIRALYPEFPAIEQKDLSLGMRGALLEALPLCADNPVMVVCVNDIIEPKGYMELAEASRKTGLSGAILAQKVSRYFPGGYLKLDGNRVSSITEKPAEGSEPSDLVNIAVHVHNSIPALLEALRNAPKEDDGYEKALDNLFTNSVYEAVPYSGIWQAVKYPWHVLGILETLLGKIKERYIHPSVQIHPSAVIEGNVCINEEVKIMAHSSIKGPCFIGARSIIGNNSLVRSSSIGNGCVIGYSSEIKSSVLARNVWTHSTYIGDSVIGQNVSFGAGSAIGNLRLDETEIFSDVEGKRINTALKKFGTAIGSDCRLGIHSGINPGIKIGKGSFISSHVLVSSDIPDNSFASMKNGALNVEKNNTGVPEIEQRSAYLKKAV